MKTWLSIRQTALCALGLSLLGARAQSPDAALYRKVGQNDFIALEKEARTLLQSDPGSVAAWLVLASIERRQGHAALSLAAAQQATKLSAVNPTAVAGEPNWRALSVYLMAEAFGDMDRREEQLRELKLFLAEKLDTFEAELRLYPAELLMASTLVKLGRANEARTIIESRRQRPGLTSTDERLCRWELASALAQLEPASREPLHLLDVLVTEYGANAPDALFQWRAWLRQRHFDADGARQDYEQSISTQRPNPLSPVNTRRELALLEARCGHWDSAITELSQAWPVLDGKAAHVRQDAYRELRLGAAQLLTMLGYPDVTAPMLDDVSDDPPRLAGTLLQKPQRQAAAELLRWLAMDAAARLPCGPAQSWRERLDRAQNALTTEATSWLVGQRAAEQIASQERMSPPPADVLAMVRGESLLLLALARVSGVAAALRLARDHPAPGPEGSAYTTALEAELAHQNHNRAAAVQAASQALNTLPPLDAVMRARMHSILAQHDPTSTAANYHRAWRLHPAIFVLAGETIPLKTDARTAPQLESMDLARIATFRDESPFLLRLQANGAQLCEASTGTVMTECSFNTISEAPSKIARMLIAPVGKALTKAQLRQLMGQTVR